MRNRPRYIPEGFKLVSNHEGFAIYHGESKQHAGKPVALRFWGKQSKPTDFYRYKDAAERLEADQRFIEGFNKTAEMKAEIRKSRVEATTLKEGDILSSSWGWEQTNVDFYQVVAVVGKRTIKIREIATKSVESTGWASDMVVAVKDHFVSDEILTKRANRNSININSCAHARLWDGNAMHRSWYA